MTTTTYRPDVQGTAVNFLEVKGVFLLSKANALALGPPKLLFNWYKEWGRASWLGVQWSGHEADHSSPSSAKIKDEWSSTCTLTYTFMACTGKVYSIFTPS